MEKKMSESCFMVPSVLLTETGMTRFFRYKLKDMRHMTEAIAPQKYRARIRSARTHSDWIRASFREEGFCREWFSRTQMIQGVQVNRAERHGIWGLMHSSMYFAGGAPRLLLHARKELDDKSRKTGEDAIKFLEYEEDPILPGWIWEANKNGDGGLASCLVDGFLAMQSADLSAREMQEAAAVVAWCIAGILEDDGILQACISRWPSLALRLETVGEPRDERKPSTGWPTRIAATTLSVGGLYSGFKPEGIQEKSVWRVHAEAKGMIRVVSALIQNDAGVHDEMMKEMRDHVDIAVRRIVQALPAGSGIGPWIERNAQERLEQIDALGPWPMVDRSMSFFWEAMEEAVRRIEGASDHLRKCEQRLQSLASDALRNADKIGAAAQDLCEAKKQGESVFQEARSIIEKGSKLTEKNLDYLLHWKKLMEGSAEKSDAKEPQTGGVHDPIAQQTQPIGAPREGVDPLAIETIDRLESDLRREREKKQAADAFIADLKKRLESAVACERVVSTEALMARLPEDYSPTPEAALLSSAMLRPKLRILPSAMRSAHKSEKFLKGGKLLRMLLLLGGEYADALDRGEPDSVARLVFGQDGYKANESDTVMSSAECVREREFDVDGAPVIMQKHLGIGTQPDIRETLRVHFERIDGRIVVGHCGQHLLIPTKV
jgi:hypothetical protein